MNSYLKLQPKALSLMILLLVISCADGGVRDHIDLSTPEATITTYCNAKSASVIQQCFYPNIKLEKEIYTPIWTECIIIEKRPTNKVGKYLGAGTGLVIEPEDIEIVAEVKMIDPPRNNPRKRFWYLLRSFGQEWKIISHSHIPDNNYPALD